MKFNPLEWSQVDGKTFQAPPGLLQLRGASLFGVVVESHGVEAAYAFASEHRLTLPDAAKVTLIAVDGFAVYRKDRPSRVYRMTGEKFTNIDRLPQESGAVAEVTKAVRLMKLEERAMIRRIREEAAASKAAIAAARAKAKAVVEDPVPDPEPEPEAEE